VPRPSLPLAGRARILKAGWTNSRSILGRARLVPLRHPAY
jgi:hypothetical protein